MKGFEESTRTELYEYLRQFVSPHKQELMETVLAQRTRYLTVVLEDVFQPHNASACLRTCEAFGVQDLHLIENRYNFDLKRDVTLGAARWLTLHRYREQQDNTEECLLRLKSQGYRLVATTPHGPSRPLEDVAIEGPTALLFGHENDGLSRTALGMADDRVGISTVGFMESLNLSVCVAILLQRFTSELRRSNVNWTLSEAERQELRLQWVRRVTRRWRDRLEKAFYEQRAMAKSDA